MSSPQIQCMTFFFEIVMRIVGARYFLLRMVQTSLRYVRLDFQFRETGPARSP